jgi:hypothetical protein
LPSSGLKFFKYYILPRGVTRGKTGQLPLLAFQIAPGAVSKARETENFSVHFLKIAYYV